MVEYSIKLSCPNGHEKEATVIANGAIGLRISAEELVKENLCSQCQSRLHRWRLLGFPEAKSL